MPWDRKYRDLRRNADAFRRLYDATARRLLAQSMAMLRRRDAAEDALQDGYVRIWMHAGRHDPARGPALPWMARIMRNVASKPSAA